MNLLKDPWIPVRPGGSGPATLVRYEDLLCQASDWQVSLPRDDLELACIQLLICLTQAIFLPESMQELRERITEQLTPEIYSKRVEPYLEWFDLDHPKWPFMQTLGIKATETTPIQKLLIGMPEGNNHAFFNAVGEVRHLGPTCAAISLFNQASDSPSFGGGFKGTLRGAAPITTLVAGGNLRETVWRNVITHERVMARLPGYDSASDKPTWVEPIRSGETIHTGRIGLLRGLFWQPAHIQLTRANQSAPCDCLGGDAVAGYSGFLKEKFPFTVNGVWPHPHGVLTVDVKKGVVKQQFASFTKTTPAWVQLSEFVVPTDTSMGYAGQSPAEPVTQFSQLYPGEPLHLLVGGYRVNQSAVEERRHEVFSIASGWADENAGNRLTDLILLGLAMHKALVDSLGYAAKGSKRWQGLGVPIQKAGEDLFFKWTEGFMHGVLRNFSFREFMTERPLFAAEMSAKCREIFNHLTSPYAHKPEFIPIIGAARGVLNKSLNKLTKDTSPDDK